MRSYRGGIVASRFEMAWMEASRGYVSTCCEWFSAERVSVAAQAYFIDRDGVINLRRPDDYVLNWSQFVFVPRHPIGVKAACSFGLPIIVISNQAAVGKGLLDPSGLEEITAQLHQALAP